jgi:hypothetical protein
MSTKPAPPPLIAPPYAAPKYKIGGTLACRLRGDVVVDGMTDAPVPWPYTRRRGDGYPSPQPILIVTGDLERAVRTESVIAICYYWGVGRQLVWRWRKGLGVTMTEGTRRVKVAAAHGPIADFARAAADRRIRAAVPPRKLAAIRSLIVEGRSNGFIVDAVGVPDLVVGRIRAVLRRAAETTTELRRRLTPQKIATVKAHLSADRADWWIADTVGVDVRDVRRIRNEAATKGT